MDKFNNLMKSKLLNNYNNDNLIDMEIELMALCYNEYQIIKYANDPLDMLSVIQKILPTYEENDIINAIVNSHTKYYLLVKS